jgi:hypothetical protein
MMHQFFNNPRVPRDPPRVIDVDEESELTSVISGETPTLDDGGEAPSIKALMRAQKAHDDAEFDLIVERILSDHRLKIGHTHFVLYEPYRPKRSKRDAWYWHPDQAKELIWTTKGNSADDHWPASPPQSQYN